jgi:CheY-like chemotaxis protein
MRMPVTRETLRIVLIENDPDDLFFLERALDKAGFTRPLIHLHDGMEAINYLTTMESPDAILPDIILTDLKMPRMNGMDFLEWLRSNPRLQELPVIVLTSSNETIDMRETTRLGIYKFLTKQVRYDNVISTLSQFILALNMDARHAAR